MVRKLFSFGATLLLAGAVFLATPGSSQAQRGHFGRARFRGAHFGGVRFGGFRAGFYHSGYNVRPSYGGYRGWYHHGPYYGAYHSGWYHYRPYWAYSRYYPFYSSYPYYYSYPAHDPVYSGYSYQPALTVPDGATLGGSVPVSDQPSSASAFPAQPDTRPRYRDRARERHRLVRRHGDKRHGTGPAVRHASACGRRTAHPLRPGPLE